MLRIFRHYVSGMMLVTLACDATILSGSVVIARDTLEWSGLSPLWPKALAFCALAVLCLYVGELYTLRPAWGRLELVLRLGLSMSAAAVLFAALGYALPALRIGRFAFLNVVAVATLGLIGARLAILRLGSSQKLRLRVLVLGTDMADLVIAHEEENERLQFTILGFIDDDPAAQDNLPPGYDLLGKTADLLTIVDDTSPDIVLIARRNMRGALPLDAILECRFRGTRVEDWPTFYEKLTGKVFLTGLRPSWLIFSDGFVKTRTTQMVKRVADVTVSFLGLLLTAPLIPMIAVLIKLDSPGPVFFRQERVGQDGVIFTLLKFRSMSANAEASTGPVWASADDPRITRVGRILRTTRLDEIPQMMNVLFGEMSFVGPRPERPAFVNQLRREIPFYSQRFSVKPGITGWAQVKHGYSDSREAAAIKLQYDLYYIKNVSFFLDLLVLLASIQVVLFGRGAR